MKMEKENNHIEQSSLLMHGVYAMLAAFRFLTIIPVGWRADKDGEYLKTSLYFFPLVGLGIGVFVGCFGMLLSQYFPLRVVSIIVVLLLAIVSGCLHLDGLADSCDGFFSSRPQEKMLEIMRDSSSGVMGVMGIISVILLKISAVSTLDYTLLFPVLVLMPFAGRVSILIMMTTLEYVRGNEGIGSLFLNSNQKNVRRAAIISILWFFGFFFFFPTQIVFSALVSTFMVVLFLLWYCHKMIDGFTGDTLGAVCELSEMAVALSVVVSPPTF